MPTGSTRRGGRLSGSPDDGRAAAGRPLRVTLVTYANRPRGSVVHTLALADALAAAGERVTVVGIGRHGEHAFFRPLDPRVRPVVVPQSDGADDDLETRVLRSVRLLADTLRTVGSDVVHAQDCIAANAAGPGCVRTVHHLDTFTSPVLVRCHERALTQPRALVCVSRPVAADLAASRGLAATVIANGVDAERFAAAAGPAGAAARAAWRQRLGATRVLATIGGIEPRKGSLQLVEAFAALRAADPRWLLAIAGGETLFDYRPYRAAVDARIDDLGLRGHVRVLGPLPEDELPAFVAAADVVALPSTHEGFGLAALEALAARRPVVCSALPVFREVFGETVRYGADPDELAAAIRQADGTDDRATAGAALAVSLPWARAAAAHRVLYRRLVRDAVPNGG